MIDIKLDTHAVRQLFPEGTEARAQLQQSVINNIVKEMVLKDSQNKIKQAVQQEISSASITIPDVRSEVKKQVQSMFHTRGWNDMSATEDMSLMMRNAAQSCAKNAIDTMISETIDSAINQAEGRIKLSIDSANRRIQEIIVNAMNKNFSDQINAAIAAKLAQHFPVKPNAES